MKNNWTATQKFVFLFLAIYLFFYTDIIGWIFGLSFENIIWDKIVPTFAAFVGSTKEVISTTMVREIHPKASEVFKDNYVLDFLALSTNFSEKNLRKSILENLKKFMYNSIQKNHSSLH